MSDPLVTAAHPTAAPKKIIARKPRDRRGKNGVPPPPNFDFTKLADETYLSNRDVASIERRAQATVQSWRMNPNHPLGSHAWDYIDGKPLLKVRTLRAFNASRATSGPKRK